MDVIAATRPSSSAAVYGEGTHKPEKTKAGGSEIVNVVLSTAAAPSGHTCQVHQ